MAPQHLDVLTSVAGLSDAERARGPRVATVLPFRTNSHVVRSAHRLGRRLRTTRIYTRCSLQPTCCRRRMSTGSSGCALGRPGGGGSAWSPIDQDGTEPASRGPTSAQTSPCWTTPPCRGCSISMGNGPVLSKHGQTCTAYCAYCFRWRHSVVDEARAEDGQPTT